jgi:hypothetical protein
MISISRKSLLMKINIKDSQTPNSLYNLSNMSRNQRLKLSISSRNYQNPIELISSDFVKIRRIIAH